MENQALLVNELSLSANLGILVLLTPNRGRIMIFFVKGGLDTELNKGKFVQTKKANPLNPAVAMVN